MNGRSPAIWCSVNGNASSRTRWPRRPPSIGSCTMPASWSSRRRVIAPPRPGAHRPRSSPHRARVHGARRDRHDSPDQWCAARARRGARQRTRRRPPPPHPHHTHRRGGGSPPTRVGAAAHKVDGDTRNRQPPAATTRPSYRAVHHVDSSLCHHPARYVRARRTFNKKPEEPKTKKKRSRTERTS
jgi:hypothetical protein